MVAALPVTVIATVDAPAANEAATAPVMPEASKVARLAVVAAYVPRSTALSPETVMDVASSALKLVIEIPPSDASNVKVSSSSTVRVVAVLPQSHKYSMQLIHLLNDQSSLVLR